MYIFNPFKEVFLSNANLIRLDILVNNTMHFAIQVIVSKRGVYKPKLAIIV